MQKPAIFTEETNDTGQQTEETQVSILPVETEQVEAIGYVPSPSSAILEESVITLETGETLHRGHDGKLYIGEYPVVQVTPHGLPTQIQCVTRYSDETATEYTVAVNDLLLVVIGTSQVSTETEAHWFSSYMYARSVLNQIITIFSETSVGSGLAYAWGSQDFLKAVTYAKEVFSLFPVQLPDKASLFASCLSMHSLITALTTGYERIDIVPFLARVMGGQAFLDVFSQLHNARLQLPAVYQDTDAQYPSNRRIGNGSGTEQRTQVSIIHKEEEAGGLRDEIVDNKNPLTQLYLAMVLGATSFLTIVLQPGISPFTACLLPLAGLSIAFKMAAYDLRPGQINFYLRYVLFSPWEITRRVLFDENQPSEQERVVLKEQNIVITEALLNAARELKPPFSDMQSTANRIAILIFEGAAIGVLILRCISAIARHDLVSIAETLIALIISSVATFYSFKVLKRKRVR